MSVAFLCDCCNHQKVGCLGSQGYSSQGPSPEPLSRLSSFKRSRTSSLTASRNQDPFPVGSFCSDHYIAPEKCWFHAVFGLGGQPKLPADTVALVLSSGFSTYFCDFILWRNSENVAGNAGIDKVNHSQSHFPSPFARSLCVLCRHRSAWLLGSKISYSSDIQLDLGFCVGLRSIESIGLDHE